MERERPDSVDNVSKELRFHGGKWATAHGSYFSDPSKSSPLVESIVWALAQARPDVIADIGGGTGFLLDQVRGRLNGGAPRLVNVDISEEQLEICRQHGIEPKLCSVLHLKRADVAHEDERLMLISRSVMHYFGRDGQDLFLGSMRSVLNRGEFLVQQPACFATAREVECMNLLYPMMGVDKFYLTPDDMREAHERNGFEVLEMRHAPSLHLRSSDLAERYALEDGDLQRMCRVLEEYGMDQGDFEVGECHFRGPFTYRIVVARAV